MVECLDERLLTLCERKFLRIRCTIEDIHAIPWYPRWCIIVYKFWLILNRNSVGLIFICLIVVNRELDVDWQLPTPLDFRTHHEWWFLSILAQWLNRLEHDRSIILVAVKSQCLVSTIFYSLSWHGTWCLWSHALKLVVKSLDLVTQFSDSTIVFELVKSQSVDLRLKSLDLLVGFKKSALCLKTLLVKTSISFILSLLNWFADIFHWLGDFWLHGRFWDRRGTLRLS